jgi:hypothetical protein
MMRLGIRPMGGKISGNVIDFTFNPVKPDFKTVHPPIKAFHPSVKTVNLLTQHLVAFDDNIQLVLNILGHYSHIMLEYFFDLFEIISIHKISLQSLRQKPPRQHEADLSGFRPATECLFKHGENEGRTTTEMPPRIIA